MGEAPQSSSDPGAPDMIGEAPSGDDRDADPRAHWPHWARRLRNVVVCVFCGATLLSLFLGNVWSLTEEGPMRDALTPFANYNSAFNTEQYWVMFSPNVGTSSWLPAIRLTFDDDSQLVLRALSEHPLDAIDSSTPESLDPNLSPDERRYAQALRIGGGRIRKLEKRTATKDGNTASARAWIRFRLSEHLRQHPEHAEKIVKIEYLTLLIRNADQSGYAHYAKMQHHFNYAPSGDEYWRGPAVPQVFAAREVQR